MTLGLATPTPLLVGTDRGAQLGLPIKGPEILESTRRVDTILLDETGTVTTGRMSLVDVAVADGVDRGEALGLVGALERASEHPIAQAVARPAEGADEADQAEPGLGVRLQRRRAATGRRRTAEPAARGSRHGGLERVRRGKRPPPATVPRGHRPAAPHPDAVGAPTVRYAQRVG